MCSLTVATMDSFGQCTLQIEMRQPQKQESTVAMVWGGYLRNRSSVETRSSSCFLALLFSAAPTPFMTSPLQCAAEYS
jgi:hypothetical protein